MIHQVIYMPSYDWTIDVYYYVSRYYTDDILYRLHAIGASDNVLHNANNLISADRLNTGLTYTNTDRHESVVVISRTSSAAQFASTLDHEKGHLVRHISEYYGIDPYSEDEQYLAGEVAEKMFDCASILLCDHCRCS